MAEIDTPSWATVDDVLALTGKAVDADTLRMANATIESNTGRIAGATLADAIPKTRRRDAEWLRRAVAYQAAWLPSQYDYHERMSLTSVGTGNSSTTFDDLAMVLGPLARNALRRCSWERSRTIAVSSGQSLRDERDPDDWGPAFPWQAL